jgi:hypothetical protein
LAALASAPAQAGFRGYEAVDAIVASRIGPENGQLALSERYLPSTLWGLMGSYQSNRGETRFVNGRPQALNTSLYYTLMTSFAADLAQHCGDAAYLGEFLHPAFVETIMAACVDADWAWKDETRLTALWLDLVSYDAPYEELTAWRDFLHSQRAAMRTGADFLRLALPSALLNPYFLLRP